MATSIAVCSHVPSVTFRMVHTNISKQHHHTATSHSSIYESSESS